MENVINAVYVNYDGCVTISMDALIVTMWNRYIEYNGGENKISLNDKEFFKNSFDNAYDAAWAASVGNYRWTDTFVCFDEWGHLMSFSHWGDENSPIDLDKIDISHIIQALQDMQTKNKKGCVNNIPRAIHDALQEV